MHLSHAEIWFECECFPLSPKNNILDNIIFGIIGAPTRAKRHAVQEDFSSSSFCALLNFCCSKMPFHTQKIWPLRISSFSFLNTLLGRCSKPQSLRAFLIFTSKKASDGWSPKMNRKSVSLFFFPPTQHSHTVSPGVFSSFLSVWLAEQRESETVSGPLVLSWEE